jgi:hypothetical protein
MQGSVLSEDTLKAIKKYLNVLQLAKCLDVHWSPKQICTSLRWAKLVEILIDQHQVIGYKSKSGIN